MNWKAVLVTWFILSALLLVSKVGEEREPIDRWDAVLCLIELIVATYILIVLV